MVLLAGAGEPGYHPHEERSAVPAHERLGSECLCLADANLSHRGQSPACLLGSPAAKADHGLKDEVLLTWVARIAVDERDEGFASTDFRRFRQRPGDHRLRLGCGIEMSCQQTGSLLVTHYVEKKTGNVSIPKDFF